jgi:rhodanese-related sulfurtransferase
MRNTTLLLLTILSLTAFSCQGQVRSSAYRSMLKRLLGHTVPELTVKQATATPTTTFLDAREPAEYEVSHISGSKLVGYDHFDLNSVASIPKETPIIVYCSVGYRSEKIAEKLIAAGYTQVSNLYGGIFEWVNEGQTVVNTQGNTDKVHAYNRTWGVWLRKGKKVY